MLRHFFPASCGSRLLRRLNFVGGLLLFSLLAGVADAAPYSITTLAGTANNAGFTDGTGSAALFNLPTGVAVDGSGNIFVADQYNHLIRKIAPGGVVTRFAGTGSVGAGDGAANAATFNFPTGVAVDGSGNVYVADRANHTIRKITSGGVVSTLAGSAGNSGTADGTGSAARFFFPFNLAADNAGNVYVADRSNHTIRKITSAGVVTTFAGTAGSLGAVDGIGSAARFQFPTGVAVDRSGNVFVADQGNDTIRKISGAGVVTTLAGSAGHTGSVDGTGAGASFDLPTNLAVDGAGNIFVTDYNNHTIRLITSGGVVSTVAGMPGSTGSSDGTGSAARFFYPVGVAADNAGAIYIADTVNYLIRLGVQSLPPAGDFHGDAPNSRSIWLMNGTNFLESVDVGTFNQSWQMVSGADFNGDGWPDIIWQNLTTGERYVWLMNGTTHYGDINLGVVPPNWKIAAVADFNGDGRVDIFWQNTVSGALYLWLMDGPVHYGDVDLGSVPTNRTVSATADFNGNGKTDLLWTNTTTGERYIWLMDGTVHTGDVSLGVVATSRRIAAAADYNGDGKADIYWENLATGERSVWLMNGLVHTGDVSLGVFPTDRSIAAVADYNRDGKSDLLWQKPGIKLIGSDFNRDGQADLVWENTATGERYLWLMDGVTHWGDAPLGTVGVDWSLAATADFNGDGQPDLLWQNTVTGERYLWYMTGVTGSVHSGDASLGTVSTEWKIAATPDLNGDGKPDLLWQNTVTGALYVWTMDGAVHYGDADLGSVPTNRTVSATADFNGDGNPDILWTNTSTGERYVWYMNGTTHTGDATLGVVPTTQLIVATADYNGDGNPDILWTNTSTGERYVWYMNGTTHTGTASITTIPTTWAIVK